MENVFEANEHMLVPETNHAKEQAAAQLDSIRCMLAALECDYDRLDELQEEYDSLKEDLEASEDTKDPQELASAITALADFEEHELPELKELIEAANANGNECKSREDAEQVIQEDPLSVEVRSGWCVPGDSLNAEEFCILLCTGGPAVRIRGDLDEDGCPTRAYMEYQDWGTPWSSYYEDGVGDTCLEYAQNFYFGG